MDAALRVSIPTPAVCQAAFGSRLAVSVVMDATAARPTGVVAVFDAAALRTVRRSLALCLSSTIHRLFVAVLVASMRRGWLR
jgi:hypothetical protein